MVTKKTKSADEILQGVINSKPKSYDNQEYKKNLAKSYYRLLDEILTKSPNDSDLLRQLIFEHKHEQKTGDSLSPYPAWVRKIAYVVVNPDSNVSEKRSELVRGYCVEVCNEYIAGKGHETIDFLSGSDFDFLSQMARVFAK